MLYLLRERTIPTAWETIRWFQKIHWIGRLVLNTNKRTCVEIKESERYVPFSVGVWLNPTRQLVVPLRLQQRTADQVWRRENFHRNQFSSFISPHRCSSRSMMASPGGWFGSGGGTRLPVSRVERALKSLNSSGGEGLSGRKALENFSNNHRPTDVCTFPGMTASNFPRRWWRRGWITLFCS